MNIQEYISSGIVESYVLGLASNEERAEFEQLAAANAELMRAKEAFEISLQQHAFDNAVPPPASLKQKIWDDIKLEIAVLPVADKPFNETRQSVTPVRTMGFAKFLAAASIILLIGSTLLNFYFYSQYKSSVAKLDELIASNQQFAANSNVMQTKLQQYERSFELMKDPAMAVVTMKGEPVAPSSLTTVYWNKQSNDVYLLVNELPKPGAGKQYQLWAIVDGVPVDAGILSRNEATGLVKMKTIPKGAQAFAITLENTGGSKTPTMPIYVVGKT
ncbi:MAG: anti-sigma factor [Chitinophagaceae bacterium]